MKIGFISNLFPPYVRGGAENVVVRTVEALTEMGEDVFVISARPRKGWKEVELDNRPMERIYRFFPGNIYFQLNDNKYPWPIRLIWHFLDAYAMHGRGFIRKVLRDEAPDVVITHNLKGVGLRIPSYIQKMNIPHIHVVHDLQLIYPSGLLFAGHEEIPRYIQPVYDFYQRMCKKRFRQPDLVIFPSEYLKNEYIKRGFFQNTQVAVVPNPAPSFTAVRKENRNPGPLRLLFVGQLEEHKGIKFLIQAFRKLDIDAQLIIAGEGTLTNYVKKQAEQDKRIMYLGYISMDHLINCFDYADAMVVPSLCYENSPTVIYESFQAGVPILAADIGGVGELVEDGKNGYLFTPGDEADLLRVIHEINQYKDRINPEHIKKTVEPHALPVYARNLLGLIKGLTK